MSWGVRGVEVRFGGRVAVRDVTLDVPAAAVTAVVGGDGAGKSTLLRALVGTVRVAAGEVRRPPVRRIGYQSTATGVYRDLTVADNLDFVAAAYRLSPGQSRRRAAVLLGRTRLDGARGRLAGALSGGMRQKLALAMALLPGPELVVLDEPTTGVDPVSRAELWRLVSAAAAEGAAVVLATSYLDEAERAGRLLVLDAGRPLARGAPRQVVAAMPGVVCDVERPPPGSRAWRRGRRWRVWCADGTAAAGGRVVVPDLQDAVTVAALAARREPARRSPAGSRPPQPWPRAPGAGRDRGRRVPGEPAVRGRARGGRRQLRGRRR